MSRVLKILRSPLALIVGLQAIIAFFALFFYKERVIFMDPAYQLFEILRTGDLAIQFYRFVAITNQIFPLLASKIGLSLSTVAQVYSLGPIIYVFVLSLIAYFPLKNTKAALALIFLQIFMVNDVFFWFQSELQHGIPALIMLIAVLQKEEMNQKLRLFWILVLSTTIVFAHPLMLIPYLILMYYFWMRKEIQFVGSIIGFVSVVAAKLVHMRWFTREYDKQALSNLKVHKDGIDFDYFWTNFQEQFIGHLFIDYYMLVIAFVFLVFVFIKEKRWMTLIAIAGGFIGHSLLVSFTFPAAAPNFYIENLLLPAGLILLIPLIWEFDDFMKTRINIKKYIPATLVVISLIRIADIYMESDKYQARLDWERNLIEEIGDLKVCISEKNAPMDTLMFSFGTPYEIWLLSTIENGKTASAIIHENSVNYNWAFGMKQDFITTWGVFPYKELNPQYFKFESEDNYWWLYPEKETR